MIRSSKIRRAAELAAVLTAAGIVFFTGCTKVDDRLGAGYQPGDQQMKIGLKVFALAPDAERPYFETRLYKTDSLKASNLGEGYFGVMHDETFGRRTAGFLTQYRAVALSDTTGFGYQPIFDSIELKIKISNYGGDTLKPMTYNVYEVISNDYLNPSLTAPAGAGSVADTLFYPTFDPTPYLNPNFMLMLVLIKCVYQLHDPFCIRVLLTAIYKFPFYMLQARDACDIGISIAFELPVR